MGELDGDDPGAPRRSFGELIRGFRTSRMLSQEVLAERTGLSVRTLRYIESGRTDRPHMSTVHRLADGLGLVEAERGELLTLLGEPAPGAVAQPPAVFTLPPATPDFCGRTSEIAQLTAALSPAMAGGAGSVAVCGVSGQPGVGKTALAVQTAHQLRAAGLFPHGQVYVDLRGAGPAPADPADVLARLLSLLGVDAAGLPEELDDRADRLRALLATRRVFLVLDNAAGERQVRPLLPGTAGSAVLITSRTRLAGLEGARLIDLDVLPEGTAVSLLAHVVGHDRVYAEAEDAARIVRFCGLLPLAIRVAGARLAARSDWGISTLARRLSDERARLDELMVGDLGVRASFELSYRHLPRRQRQLFRRLALLEYPDVPEWIAGALMGSSNREGGQLLERLVDAHLVESAGLDRAGQPRYRLHDLLRVYARERLSDEDAGRRAGALARVSGGWLALAERAAPAVRSGTMTLTHGDAPRWAADRAVLDLVDARPLEWFEAEHVQLTEAVANAGAAGLDEAAWDIAGCLAPFYMIRSYFDAWRRSQEVGLAAARRAGRPAGEAHLLRSLAHLLSEQDRVHLAVAHLEQAVDIFAELGDREGEAGTLDDLAVLHHLEGQPDVALPLLARAHSLFASAGDGIGAAHVEFSLGMVHLDQGDYGAAAIELAHARAVIEQTGDLYTLALILRKLAQLHRTLHQLDEAASILAECRDVDSRLGDRLGEALTLQSLGEVRRRQGRRAEAYAILDEALTTFRSMGYGYGEALVLRSLGDLHRADARPGEAIDALRLSLGIWRRLGRPRNEAHTLASIGDAHAELGDAPAAVSAWNDAVRLYETIDAPETDDLKRRLTAIAGPDAS
jgi:tetratricopeptide (TPR) repeat protein/DNA-binding XRE family transcriptional regulator